MDWFTARFNELKLLLGPPHWGAVGFVLVCALFWTRLGPPLRLFRLASVVALGAGILLYPITVLWVQPDLQRATRDLLISLSSQQAFDSRPLLAGAASSLIHGASQEILKLMAIVLVILALGYRREAATAVTLGLLAALGFALFEGERFVTPALNAGLTWQTSPPLVRELFLVGAHLGTGMMLGKACVDGRFVRYFLIASLMHAALAYAAVLQVSGWAPNGVLAYFAAVAALAFFWGSAIATARK